MGVVVVVDDNLASQSFFQAALSRSGWKVFTAESAAKAVEHCHRHDGPIDLFILDISLPVRSGMEFAMQIRDFYPDTPVLFTSGTPIEFWNQADHQNLSRMPCGSCAFLPKPFTYKMLMQKISELLDAAGAHHCGPSESEPRRIRRAAAGVCEPPYGATI